MTRKKATLKYGRPSILVVGSAGGEEIRRAGGDAKYVSIGDPRAIEAAGADAIHGLLLLGGGDVDPALYGRDRDATVYGVAEDRDLIELNAYYAATERGIPVMGICRGAQLMNVANGGTLHLDIVRDAGAHSKHRGCDHRVKAVRGSRLAKAWMRDEAWVTSIHHQAVADVAPGFVATGHAHDGIVEAIESVKGWEVGVQFHPEIGGRPSDQRLFDRFLFAAGRRAGMRVQPATWNTPMTVSESTGALVPAKPRPRVASASRSGPVRSRWSCGRCGIKFDERNDFEDHRVLLHGDARLSLIEGGKR